MVDGTDGLNDLIDGLGGNDTIFGDLGHDRLHGGLDNNSLIGGTGQVYPGQNEVLGKISKFVAKGGVTIPPHDPNRKTSSPTAL